MESVRYADVRRKEEDGRILKTAAGKQKGKHDQSQSLLLRDLGGGDQVLSGNNIRG